MIGSADEQSAAAHLLEVAFQAQVRVADGQQLGVDRPVRGVANGAAFMQGLVFENKRTALRGVAANAGIVLGKQRGAAAGVDGARVRGMAGGAGQIPSGTGWWLGRLNWPRTSAWHWKQTVSVLRAGGAARRAP